MVYFLPVPLMDIGPGKDLYTLLPDAASPFFSSVYFLVQTVHQAGDRYMFASLGKKGTFGDPLPPLYSSPLLSPVFM